MAARRVGGKGGEGGRQQGALTQYLMEEKEGGKRESADRWRWRGRQTGGQTAGRRMRELKKEREKGGEGRGGQTMSSG